jgi:hypothetical protein
MNNATWAMLNETEKALLKSNRTPISKRASASARAATRRTEAKRDAR